MPRTDWSAIRAAYQGGCGIDDLCAEFEISRQGLMRKKREGSWAAPGAEPPAAAHSASIERPVRRKRRKADYLNRLFSLLEQTMSNFEARLANGPAEAAGSRDGDAKLLNSMAALYEKLKGMQTDEAEGRAARREAGTAADDESGLRERLAARLDGLRRGIRPGENLPGDSAG
jgi:hypothetical protein